MFGIRELLTTLISSTAIASVAFLWLFFSMQKQSKAPLWWAAGELAFAVGLVLLMVRGYIPDAYSIVVANMVAISGYFFIWQGIREYSQQKHTIAFCTLYVPAITLHVHCFPTLPIQVPT